MIPRSNNVAFLVCDLQEKFQKVMFNFPAVVAVASRMMDAASILHIPLIVAEQYPEGLGRTVPELLSKFESLQSDNKFLFSKTLFSMYIQNVKNTLESRNVKHVALMGVEAHVCILQTALDLLGNDIKVHLLTDGISARHLLERDVALRRLQQDGAILSTSESFLFQLLCDSTHEKFKSISDLVKSTDKNVFSLWDSMFKSN